MLPRARHTRLSSASAAGPFRSLRQNLILDTVWARLERWKRRSRSWPLVVARCCRRCGCPTPLRAGAWSGFGEKCDERRSRWPCRFRLDLGAVTRRSYLREGSETANSGATARDSEFGGDYRDRFGESVWSDRGIDSALRGGTRIHHDV